MRGKARKRKMISLFLAVFLMGVSVIPIQAEEPQGSLTVCYQGTSGTNVRFLTQMEVRLYRVGTSGVGGELEEEFQDSGLSLEDLESLSVSERQRQAEKTAEYAEMKQIHSEEKKTDEKGEVFFDGLSYGLYLVVPRERYHAETGSFLCSPFFASLPLQGDANPRFSPKSQWTGGITIGVEELVVYTGGNELQEEHPDGFPNPRYTGIPEKAQWRLNGTLWEEEGYPFEVTYTRAEDEEGMTDSGIPAENDEQPGVYFVHIRPLTEGAAVTCSTDGFEHEQDVTFTTGRLIVRNINENKNDDQLGEIVSGSSTASQGLTQRQQTDLENGVGTAVIPDDSVITVNGKKELGTVAAKDSGLLFDELLYYGTQNAETGALVLEDRAEESLTKNGASMDGRKYQSRYLDLVDYQDGNLWLSSSKGVDVYWPYPDGTDKDTDFTLFHFRGLHREYAIMGNADLETQVKTAPMEQVKVEKTENGIRFHIQESGFSPFVLSWTEEDGTVQWMIDSVKTGDKTAVAGMAALMAVSGSVCIFLFTKRKKQNR